MLQPVYIVGMGQIPVQKRHEATLRQLGAQVVRAALQDAGLDRVGALYLGNMLSDELQSQKHVAALVADEAGLAGIEALQVRAATATLASQELAGRPLELASEGLRLRPPRAGGAVASAIRRGAGPGRGLRPREERRQPQGCQLLPVHRRRRPEPGARLGLLLAQFRRRGDHPLSREFGQHVARSGARDDGGRLGRRLDQRRAVDARVSAVLAAGGRGGGTDPPAGKR